jgi:hypothetical protein
MGGMRKRFRAAVRAGLYVIDPEHPEHGHVPAPKPPGWDEDKEHEAAADAALLTHARTDRGPCHNSVLRRTPRKTSIPRLSLHLARL